MNITDKSIQSYIAKAERDTTKKYKHFSIGNNLWLRVSTKYKRATWLFRVALPDSSQKAGYKFTYYPIGLYPLITFKNARDKTDELNDIVRAGKNPLDLKKQEIESQITLKQIWEKWLAAATLKPGTTAKFPGLFKHHLAKLGDKPFLSITSKEAYNTIIQPILDNGHKAQAKIVVSKLRQLSRFACEAHLINKNNFVDLVLPEAYKGKKERRRTLSIEELHKFLPALDELYDQKVLDIRYHHLIKLTLLLGTRKCELAFLKWENYNQATQTILLTGTKTDDDLLIKLPPQANNLLQELKLQQLNDYAFPSLTKNAPLCIRSILYNLHKVEARAELEDLTMHDLRRTFSSRLTGLKFRLELVEKALNHQMQGTARHYQFDDMLEERYQMLMTWADFLDNLPILN